MATHFLAGWLLPGPPLLDITILYHTLESNVVSPSLALPGLT